MNVADLDAENAPGIYMLASSMKLSTLAGEGELERLGLGRRALAKSIEFRGEGTGPDTFGHFIRLKESEGLYYLSGGKVDRLEKAGVSIARCTFLLPAKLPLGQYEIRAFAFRNGRGRLLGKAFLEVKQVGLVAWLRQLAFSHGFLFGVVAVLIALAVGLATGFVFGKGGSH